MLTWALRATRGSGAADLLELYCGNGNFTIPLAANFRRVVATEVSKASVDAARHNIQVRRAAAAPGSPWQGAKPGGQLGPTCHRLAVQWRGKVTCWQGVSQPPTLLLL
jgi:hypothetical protein